MNGIETTPRFTATPCDVHCTPGRMRVRSLQWKENTAALHAVQARLCAATGVHTVQANPLTGSLLIRFDPRANSSEALLRAALSAPPLPEAVIMRSNPHRAAGRRFVTGAARKAGTAACTYAGEKLAQHLLGVMIAAIL